MDPLDQGRAGLDGTACAVCDGPVPIGSTRILAHREDLAFLRVDCPGCGSTSLAFATGRGPAAAPVSPDDVLDMHELLRDWHGGLAELLPGARSDAR